MSETSAVEPTVTTTPSTKQKVALTVSQTVVGLAVTIAAGVLTNRINKQVENFIIPPAKEG